MERSLKDGMGSRVNKVRINEVRIAEGSGRGAPLTLNVSAIDWCAPMIGWGGIRVVFDQYVVEGLGAGFVGHSYDGAVRIEERGAIQPKVPSLEVIAVPSRNIGTSHSASTRWKICPHHLTPERERLSILALLFEADRARGLDLRFP